MPILKTINTNDDIPTSSRWSSMEIYAKVQYYNVNGNSVEANYQGRKFLLVERKKYIFSKSERAKRIFVGVIATICTLVVGIFFIKGIRNLFARRKIVDFAVALTSEQEKLIAEFTPQMIEALGGVNKVMNLPRYPEIPLADHPKRMYKNVIKHPLSIIEKEIPTIAFCYATPSNPKAWEHLQRKNNRWGSVRTVCLSAGELHLGIPSGTESKPSSVEDNSSEAKYLLDKVRRLVQRREVGALKDFPIVRGQKSTDTDSFRPADAYLEVDEYENYRKGRSQKYEPRPPEGSTEVYLCDPTKSPEENLADIQQKFPNTVLPKTPESTSFLFRLRPVDRRASTGSMR